MVEQPPNQDRDNQGLNPDVLERFERIDGVIYDMSPSPSTDHQRIAGRLLLEIGNYLRGKTCEVFPAPFDVYLDADEKGNYVTPDLTIVCKPEVLRERGCYGVPDLIIEILSPSTAKKDKTTKLKLYKKYGVQEYWLVDVANQNIEVYTEATAPFPTVYSKAEGDKIKVTIFEDLEIDLGNLFF